MELSRPIQACNGIALHYLLMSELISAPEIILEMNSDFSPEFRDFCWLAPRRNFLLEKLTVTHLAFDKIASFPNTFTKSASES